MELHPRRGVRTSLTIETEEPAPIAAGLGATLPADPYAGAAPMSAEFAVSIVQPAVGRRSEISDPTHAGPPTVQQATPPTLVTAKEKDAALKSARCEVLAQPGGGFTSARIVQSSGDAQIDRRILVAVMHHQELVEPRRVDQPQWLLLSENALTHMAGE